MSIKVRTKKSKDGITVVSAMLRHPMETGRRIDPKTNKLIPVEHITEVSFDLNEETVMSAVIGGGISKNPFFSFYLQGAESEDILSVSWKDILGNTDSIKTILK